MTQFGAPPSQSGPNDFDFFASPLTRTASPGPSSTAPGSGAAAPVGASGPVDQFGNPIQAPPALDGSPPANPFGAPTAHGYTAPGRTRSPSTGRKVLIAALVAVVGLVGVGILAAVAVPIVLNQRATSQASGTTVSLPPSIGNKARLTDAKSKALEATMVQKLGGGALAGLYGSPREGASLVVAALPGPINQIRINLEMAAFGSRASAEGTPASDVDPGALGGQARCHDMSQGGQQMTNCLFADPGALVSVSLVGTGPAARQQAVEARAVIERRAG